MEEVFGSPKINRKQLVPNNRRSVKAHFHFNANLGYKSKANSSVVSWASSGKGVQGESVNAKNNANRMIVNKNWKPL